MKINTWETKKLCDCGALMFIEYSRKQRFESMRPNKDVIAAHKVDFVLNNVGHELAQCTECGVSHAPMTFKEA